MPDPKPQSVIELLQAMVRINTVNGAITGRACAEAELVGLLEQYARAWGLETTRLPLAGYADQLLITCNATGENDSGGTSGGGSEGWLLFDSHLDTVAVEGMTIDPFGAKIQGDKLFGRGACDTKGTGAAMLWALKQYASQNDRPHNIALLFSVDEEIAMQGVQAFVTNDLPKLGWLPSAVIVGEPTEHTPVIAHNGCVRWELITHGKAVHSSTPGEGRSAIADMVRALAAIQSQYIDKLDIQDDLTGLAACSVNLIQGGSAPNIIPDRCVAEIDRRLVPGEDPSTVLPAVAAVIDQAVAGDAGFAYEQKLLIEHPPLSSESGDAALPIVRSAMHACGVRRPAVGAPFATHAGYFSQAGLPTVVFGPGSPYPAHTKDEWVSIKEIEQGTRVYQAMMCQNLRD